MPAESLEAALRDVVEGEVRFDAGSRALYATDASNYRQVPIGVVLPRHKRDVERALAVCRAHDAPILSRGGGTSLAGQCCNVAVVFDFSKYMNKVLDIDPEDRSARVEPGCVLDTLRTAAEAHGLTFGPDPATHDRCTLGGMIGNNSCGVHSQMSGRTVDYVLELEVLTYDGARFWVGPTDAIAFQEIIRAGGRKGQIHRDLLALRDRYAEAIRQGYPKDLPRRVSGYDLPDLLPERCNVARALVGSEATCVIVLEARLRLIPSPPARTMLLVGWPDIMTLADHIPEILDRSDPIGLEAFDAALVAYMRRKHLHEEDLGLLTEGDAWMIVEFGGTTKAAADDQAKRLTSSLDALRRKRERRGEKGPYIRHYDQQADAEKVWELRESGLGATARVPGRFDTWPGWEDAAVPPDRLGEYLRDFRDLLDEYDLDAALYGHFGMGCVHTRIPFDLKTREGIRDYRSFVTKAAHIVVSYGGSLSGEHGDGQARAELLSIMYGPEVMTAMRAFKAVWDPLGRMNPGKVVDPDPLDANLRLGVDHAPWEPKTVFAFPEDEGRLSRAAQRCVGVGKCRRTDGGTMCPSYMVTLEEEHSTRGRAHLLFEMMQGDVITDGWHSEAVKDALDLCISCKGCLGECPVDVDMATYKAEFLYHYHKHKRRPRSAYAFGYIDLAARMASAAPRLANLATRAPLASIAKRIAGLAPERPLPRFAHQTFREWFEADHEPKNPDGERVLVFADTFTNHFHPHIGKAAVDVLERAGHRVALPERQICCGRPLYDHGMLPRAKRLLGKHLEALRGDIRAGTPMIGLEPSCTAVFRDELKNLYPDDEDARRLAAQTHTLAGFLHDRPDALRRLGLPVEPPERSHDRAAMADPPEGPPQYLVQRHCHHQAVMGHRGELALLDRMGVDYEVLDSGCCGLAGSFGFEADHYDLSMQMGERVLFPRIRDAPRQTGILADGFSCRTQIKDGTRRNDSRHIAELLADWAPRRTDEGQAKERSLLKRLTGGRT